MFVPIGAASFNSFASRDQMLTIVHGSLSLSLLSVTRLTWGDRYQITCSYVRPILRVWADVLPSSNRLVNEFLNVRIYGLETASVVLVVTTGLKARSLFLRTTMIQRHWASNLVKQINGFVCNESCTCSSAMAHALSYEFHRRRRLSMMATGSLSSSSSFFPSSHELIVTTNEGVYSWTSEGVGQVFSSGSGGIVGAKRTGSQRGLLAVADSQVVILHDVNQGMRHSYRLKGTEVSATSSSL